MTHWNNADNRICHAIPPEAFEKAMVEMRRQADTIAGLTHRESILRDACVDAFATLTRIASVDAHTWESAQGTLSLLEGAIELTGPSDEWPDPQGPK